VEAEPEEAASCPNRINDKVRLRENLPGDFHRCVSRGGEPAHGRDRPPLHDPCSIAAISMLLGRSLRGPDPPGFIATSRPTACEVARCPLGRVAAAEDGSHLDSDSAKNNCSWGDGEVQKRFVTSPSGTRNRRKLQYAASRLFSDAVQVNGNTGWAHLDSATQPFLQGGPMCVKIAQSRNRMRPSPIAE